MSLSKPRTTFNAEELERLSGAQHRLYGMYEVLGKSPINARSGANTVLVPPQQNRQKDSETYEPQYFDSGLGDELPEDGPPKPPLLMTDIENQDSGIGPESMDTDDDDIEKDGIKVDLSSKSVTTNNVEKRTHPKAPRRPKVNHLKTANPVTTISNSRVKVNTATTAKSRSLHMHSVSREQPAVTVRRTNTAAARVNLPKVENTPSKTWGSTFDIFSFQRHIQYFLPNKDGDTGLHLAVIHSQGDLLDRLLFTISREPSLKPIINEQNGLFQTALHLAAHTQQHELVRKLLVCGASLSLTDHKGNTPLHVVCRFSSSKCLEEILRLVKLSAILEAAQIRNNEGLTCMHIAVQHKNTDALRKLKSIGVDINMQDFHCGKTALHLAIEKDSPADVQFLIENCQANVNATTYSGCTPLHTASGRGNIVIVAYLLSMGANPELLTDEGDSALDLAGSEQVMTLLTKAAALKWLS